MDCKPNTKDCACSYPGCPRHGRCCECVAYHRGKNQVTACFFSPAAERTYDRSIANLARDKGLL
ncbi:DUF6485 family protein [Desulfurispirillum indicum]|uniref:Cytosolic protein n=1 Tax=Desulfurispirillum indicum (strain ATCC BAA-1389 / DSM 22839 / S5) TaxID=653733 RepID=E6W1B8_DESIS|nr:DUF6485 family protein [Desulfurispirillum indicum]ADU65374.1 hypothetical protein Selin_0626 [Desulfurispirillum indicum S5]UCZ57267.1 DUF6485 family protein [Desulfurispirillum indicum]